MAGGSIGIRARFGHDAAGGEIGSMTKAVRQRGNETVILEFTVDPNGGVMDVHPLEGEKSPSLEILKTSISTWKFEPASNGADQVPATARVLLIKGEDQFRHEVSSDFRELIGSQGSHNVCPRVPHDQARYIWLIFSSSISFRFLRLDNESLSSFDTWSTKRSNRAAGGSDAAQFWPRLVAHSVH